MQNKEVLDKSFLHSKISVLWNKAFGYLHIIQENAVLFTLFARLLASTICEKFLADSREIFY